MQPPDEEKLKGLLVEFEFNSIGRRLFGEEFKAGRGGGSPKSEVQSPKSLGGCAGAIGGEQLVLVSESGRSGGRKRRPKPAATSANLKTIADVPHEYHLVDSPAERAKLIKTLQS